MKNSQHSEVYEKWQNKRYDIDIGKTRTFKYDKYPAACSFICELCCLIKAFKYII